MGYDNIKELKQVYTDEEANPFLKKGFKLIRILSTRRSTNDLDETRPCYILGLA
jgi:hypothetical protein